MAKAMMIKIWEDAHADGHVTPDSETSHDTPSPVPDCLQERDTRQEPEDIVGDAAEPVGRDVGDQERAACCI